MDQRKGNRDMAKEMAINEVRMVMPWKAQQKHSPTHATPSIEETFINRYTTKDWLRLHPFLPVRDTLNRDRIPSMHLWLPPPDT
jgi:hypothetical protein